MRLHFHEDLSACAYVPSAFFPCRKNTRGVSLFFPASEVAEGEHGNEATLYTHGSRITSRITIGIGVELPVEWESS